MFFDTTYTMYNSGKNYTSSEYFYFFILFYEFIFSVWMKVIGKGFFVLILFHFCNIIFFLILPILYNIVKYKIEILYYTMKIKYILLKMDCRMKFLTPLKYKIYTFIIEKLILPLNIFTIHILIRIQ